LVLVASLCVPGRDGGGGFVAGMEMLTRGTEMLTGGMEMLTRAPLAVLARAVEAGEGMTAEGIAAPVVVTAPAEKAAPVFPKLDPDT
jgi:hypothetical protein